MAIKHLKPKTFKEMEVVIPRVPFWKKTEYWRSPLAIFLIIGFLIYGILYALFYILKWALFSWIRPFTDSPLLCKIGFHKYRKLGEDNSYINFLCEICNKSKREYDDPY